MTRRPHTPSYGILSQIGSVISVIRTATDNLYVSAANIWVWERDRQKKTLTLCAIKQRILFASNTAKRAAGHCSVWPESKSKRKVENDQKRNSWLDRANTLPGSLIGVNTETQFHNTPHTCNTSQSQLDYPPALATDTEGILSRWYATRRIISWFEHGNTH